MIPSSKYVEDEHPGHHSSVWGSYFDLRENAWGYACCKTCSYSAYCTAKKKKSIDNVGKKGKQIVSKKPKRMVTVASKPSNYFYESKKTLKSGYLSVRGVASEIKHKLTKGAGVVEPASKRQKTE